MQTKDWLSLLQALIIGGMALLGIVITQSWTTRREYAKRRIEFAEEVLAQFYEVSDAIRFIRSPFSGGGEGSTRIRPEHEAGENTALLNNAYVVIERYQKQEAVFSSLKAKRHRFMAMFRGHAAEPFDDIEMALRKIFVASEMLGSHYWQRQGRVEMEPAEFEAHLKGMHEQEAIFWTMPGTDVITPLVSGAVKKVETITDAAARQYVHPIDWWERWKAYIDSMRDAHG